MEVYRNPHIGARRTNIIFEVGELPIHHYGDDLAKSFGLQLPRRMNIITCFVSLRAVVLHCYASGPGVNDL